MPYQPWVQVLEDLVRAMPAAVAASLQDELAEIRLLVPQVQRTMPALGWSSPTDPATAQYRLFTAVEAILTDAARRWPVLVVIDDLQWATSQTLALLRHLSRPAASQLLVVGTFRDTRDEVTEPLATCLAELRRSESTSRLALGGLDRRAVEQFVAGAVGHELDPDLLAVASALEEHSGGNAFYVNELWRHLVADGVLERAGDRWVVRSSEHGVPDSVREVVAHRAKKLAAPAQRVLELAAIAGQHVDRRVLETAVDLPAEEVASGIDELVQAKMFVAVGDALPIYHFAHAIVRETVAESIPPSTRALLHLRAGEAIESVFASDLTPVFAELAGHFAAAAASGGAAKATEYARRAATQAVALVAYDEAITHLTIAVQLSPPASEERVDNLLALGAAGVRQGLAREAMTAYGDAFRLARELGLMEQAVRAAAGFEETMQLHGLPGGPAVEIVSRALGLLGDDDSPLRTRLQACLAMALIFAGRREEADRIGQRAIASARRHGDPVVLLAALKADLPDGARWVRTAQEMREVASQVDDPWSLALARSIGIRGLLMEGRIDDARAAISTFRRAVEKSRFVLYRYMGMAFDVMLSVIDGRLDDAERLAEEAQDFGSSSGIESDAGVYGVHMYVIRREQGRLAEVAPVLRLASALEPDAPVWRPGLAALFVDTGMLEDARREFETLAADDFASLPRDAMWPCSLTFLSEVCTALGDQRRAEVLYRELETYRGLTMVVGYTVCLGPAERLMGSLAACMGRDDAESHFAAALGLAERSGSPVWRAHVQYDWAVALGDRPDLLEAAGEIARQTGLAALAERCRGLLADPA
jgi:tetratricopeptide (TPR) repeat protein